MKILVIIGLVIVFITSFFTLFIFDALVKNQINCLNQMSVSSTPGSTSIVFTPQCDTKELSISFVFGLATVSFFVLIDICVGYLIVKNILKGEKTAAAPF